MAGSVNKVILIGNLGKDPEIRTLQSGTKVANLSVATSENWNDKQTGERKERTEWHRVVIFNDNLVKVAENYLRKGSKIYLEGALQTRKYTDQAGAEKFSTEVVLQKFRGELTMLDGRGGGDEDSGGSSGGGGFQRAQPSGPRESFAADLDDEIPFEAHTRQKCGRLCRSGCAKENSGCSNRNRRWRSCSPTAGSRSPRRAPTPSAARTTSAPCRSG